MGVSSNYSCRLSLSSIIASRSESTIQIIQNLSFESIHVQFIAQYISKGYIGDIYLLGSVGKEMRIRAIRTGC